MHWALVDGGILKGGELQRNKWMLARGWELGVFSGELRASSSGVKNGKGEDGRGDGTVQKPLRVCALTLQMGLPKAPLSMESSRQEYWSGLPSTSPGDLRDPGIVLRYPASQADSLPSEPPGKPEPQTHKSIFLIVYSERAQHTVES